MVKESIDLLVEGAKMFAVGMAVFTPIFYLEAKYGHKVQKAISDRQNLVQEFQPLYETGQIDKKPNFFNVYSLQKKHI
ncbi:hypothetical protein ACFL1H_05695 [Nanoarchaeota archaeon]